MVARGRLVAFEGIDGCGKSTQAERWLRFCTARHPERECLAVREPGDTELGEAIRALVLEGGPWSARAEMLLYMAARAELYEQRIGPALARGALVIADRSSYSTAAYQGHGLGLDPEEILRLGRLATRDLWPDRVVLLRLAPDVAAGRLAGRPADRIEARGRDYFQRVSDGFDRFAEAEPERFVVVDGSLPPDEVEQAIRRGLADVA